MAEILDLSDPDFTAQMQGLVEQAQQELVGERATAPKVEGQERPSQKETQQALDQRALQSYQSLPQVLRPFVAGLEAITRATGDNTQLLVKLDKASGEASEPLRQLPVIVGELQTLIEKKDALSKQMFDALHEELRSYKDDFLLETVHRPIIRDLITLHDDLTEICRQMQVAVAVLAEAGSSLALDRLRTIEVNVHHNLEFILEVLARFEVSILPVETGKLNKQTQRAIAIEPAANAEEDFDIIRNVKRGFLWKDRIVRPEEVVVKKWRETVAGTL